MTSILPPSTDGANELAKLWNAGQYNELPRSITMKLIALKIIELIASKKISIPDQSLCLLGAVRIYQKLFFRLKKDIEYTDKIISSNEILQNKMEKRENKIQNEIDTKLFKNPTQLKNQIKREQKRQKLQYEQEQKMINPSPSTIIGPGIFATIPEEIDYNQYEDQGFAQNENQPYNFDPNLAQSLPPNYNYDFDPTNPANQHELLTAINDLEALGANELSYLYNIGQNLPILPQDRYDEYGEPLSDDHYSAFGTSFFNTSVGSNAVLVRDQHNLNQSRLSMGSPLGHDRIGMGIDQFDMGFGGKREQNAFDQLEMGFDFDELSSPLNSQEQRQLDQTGLTISELRQLQQQGISTDRGRSLGNLNLSADAVSFGERFDKTSKQMELLNQTGLSSANISSFQGLGDFLFNIVIGNNNNNNNDGIDLSNVIDENLKKIQKKEEKERKKKVRAQILAGDEDIGAQIPSARRKPTVPRPQLPILHKNQRKVEPNDVDNDIFILAPQPEQLLNILKLDEHFDEKGIPTISSKPDSHDLYGLSSEPFTHGLLSSEGSDVIVRDYHPHMPNTVQIDQYLSQKGKNLETLPKFAQKNFFANPQNLLSPFKYPQLAPNMQSHESQFSNQVDFGEQYDMGRRRRTIEVGHAVYTPQLDLDLSSDFDLDGAINAEPININDNGRYTLAAPLHNQEEFNFSFISNHSSALTKNSTKNSLSHLEHTVNFLDSSSTLTTNKSSVVELYDVLSVAPVGLVGGIIEAQKDATVYKKDKTFSVCSDSSHRMNTLTSLQSLLTIDVSNEYPIPTLASICNQNDQNIDGFDGHFEENNHPKSEKKSKKAQKRAKKDQIRQNDQYTAKRTQNNNYDIDIDSDVQLGIDIYNQSGEIDAQKLAKFVEKDISKKFENYENIANISLGSISSAFKSYFTTNPTDQQSLHSMVYQDEVEFDEKNETLSNFDNKMAQISKQSLHTTNTTSTLSSLIQKQYENQHDIEHIAYMNKLRTKPLVPIKPQQKSPHLPLSDVLALEEYDSALPNADSFPKHLFQDKDIEEYVNTVPNFDQNLTLQYPLHTDIYTLPSSTSTVIPSITAFSSHHHPSVRREQREMVEREEFLTQSLQNVLLEGPFVDSVLTHALISDYHLGNHIDESILENDMDICGVDILTNKLILEGIYNKIFAQKKDEENLLKNLPEEEKIKKQKSLPGIQLTPQSRQEVINSVKAILPPKVINYNTFEDFSEKLSNFGQNLGQNLGESIEVTKFLQKIQLDDIIRARQAVMSTRKQVSLDLWSQQRMALSAKHVISGLPRKGQQIGQIGQIGQNFDENEYYSDHQQQQHHEGLSSDGQLNSDDLLLQHTYEGPHGSYFSHSMFADLEQKTGHNFLEKSRDPFAHFNLDEQKLHQTPFDFATQQQLMRYDGDVVIDFALPSSTSDSEGLFTQFDQNSAQNKHNIELLARIGGVKHKDQFGKVLDLTAIGDLGQDGGKMDQSLTNFGDFDPFVADLDFGSGQINLNQLDNHLLKGFEGLQQQYDEFGDYFETDRFGQKIDGTQKIDEEEVKEKGGIFDDQSDDIISQMYSSILTQDRELSSSGMLSLSDTIHDLEYWAKHQDDLLSTMSQKRDNKDKKVKKDKKMSKKDEKILSPEFSYQKIIKALGYDSKHLLSLILSLFREKKLEKSDDKSHLSSSLSLDSDLDLISISDKTTNIPNTNRITLHDVIKKRLNVIYDFYKKHEKNQDKIDQKIKDAHFSRSIASSTFFLILHLVKHGVIHMKQDQAYGTMTITLVPIRK